MSTKQQTLIGVALIVLLFAVWAKIDYTVFQQTDTTTPPQYYDFGQFRVRAVWFWMWIVHVPVTALVVAWIFWAGAPGTQRNLKIAVGLFLTVIILWIGTLEDFFFFVLNDVPFPAGEWEWFQESPLWWIFGTWNTTLHLYWLLASILATVAMWILIFRS